MCLSWSLQRAFVLILLSHNSITVYGDSTRNDCMCIHADNCFYDDIRHEESLSCQGRDEVCCTKQPNEDTVIKGCGLRNPEGVLNRVVHLDMHPENEAEFGEFPWMVAIHEEISGMANYKCGGALIHESVVLTAAHCLYGKEPTTLKLTAGEWDMQNTEEMLVSQERRVSQVIIHENFKYKSLHNDIALLVTDEPFKYGKHIDEICLPAQDEPVFSKECIATGWGKNASGTQGVIQEILKKVVVPMVSRDDCTEALKKHPKLGPSFTLHNSFLCAGGQMGKDTCQGDGGSPLVCPIPGNVERYHQVGIVAWGIGCGADFPGVYVNVPFFRSWIDSQLSLLNLS